MIETTLYKAPLTNVRIEDDLFIYEGIIQGLLNFSWENFIIAVRQKFRKEEK